MLRTRHTLRFGSPGGFAYPDLHLHPSTGFSVLSLLRPRFAQTTSNGILTVSSIGFAVRLRLRARLTLIRLTLIRKPLSFGEEVSHLLYRYLYLHLLFQKLQQGSSLIFRAAGMLPYHLLLDPLLRYTVYARLLSTPNSSTSELLRTL